MSYSIPFKAVVSNDPHESRWEQDGKLWREFKPPSVIQRYDYLTRGSNLTRVIGYLWAGDEEGAGVQREKHQGRVFWFCYTHPDDESPDDVETEEEALTWLWEAGPKWHEEQVILPEGA